MSGAWPPKPETVPLFGIPVSRAGMDETVEYLTRVVETGRPHRVVTVNPIMVMAGLRDPRYMEVLRTADLVVPDGTGIVWAAARAGVPVKERVPGIELMLRLLAVGNERRWRVYFLGAADDVVREAADRLAKRFPGMVVVGVRDGYFSDDEDNAVVEAIRGAEPHLLFVGRSAERQDPWLARHKECLGVPVMMGVGGSFDVLSGRLRRAPASWQRLGLEWLYRLLQEPGRIRRMATLPAFIAKVLLENKRILEYNNWSAHDHDQ